MVSLLATAASVVQFLIVLLQLLPDAIKAWQAFEKARDERLNAAARRDLVNGLRAGVKAAAETKDTSKLERLFGRPEAKPGEAKSA